MNWHEFWRMSAVAKVGFVMAGGTYTSTTDVKLSGKPAVQQKS